MSAGRFHADAGRTIGFDLQPLPNVLEAPTSIEPAVTKTLAYLENYWWVLSNNGSISFNRGESPFSTQLCELLGRIFTIPKPDVLEGPSISWVRVVLFAGPSPGHLDQTASLKVGESTIQLSEEDHKLLLSGRPWQLLNPWPDERDYLMELALVKEDMDGLQKVEDTLCKAVELVNGVRQQLLFRHNRLCEPCCEQPRPSAFESSDPPDIIAPTHISSGTTELALKTGILGDEATQQACNLESSTNRIDSPPYEFRDSTRDNRHGPSTPIVEGEYIDVAQLSTCDGPASWERYFMSQPTEDLLQRASPDTLPSSPKCISPFIRKLIDALEDSKNSEQISWSDDGNSFIIYDWRDFEEKVLPSICSHKTYQKFVRLLRYHDFQLKQATPKTAWKSTKVREYFNSHFRRGDNDSLPLIQAQWRKSPAPPARTEDSATPLHPVRATLQSGSNEDDDLQGGTTAKRTRGVRIKFIKKRRAHRLYRSREASGTRQ